MYTIPQYFDKGVPLMLFIYMTQQQARVSVEFQVDKSNKGNLRVPPPPPRLYCTHS